MNATYIFNKATSAFWWVVNQITKKYTAPYNLLKKRFPILEENKAIKYSIIPIAIALFAGLRWILKSVINAIATWTSNFAGETADLDISQRSIVIAVSAILISIKLIQQFTNSKKSANV